MRREERNRKKRRGREERKRRNRVLEGKEEEIDWEEEKSIRY